ncbi:MAG: DNA primase [Chloroflexi bacterium]|nr:DNA primase [Chloroflexota bacterium]
MSTTDEIKAKIDIVDLVSEAGVKLRKAGRNYTGFCPFHDNKHTPAFVVWPESGTWRCFGQCNEGGDIFKFVMKREGIDFREALQKLAQRAGVQIQEFQHETPQVKEAHEHLRKLLEDALVFYRSHLFQNQDVLSYLREKRKLTDATIETFGLGYAPSGWDTALKHFTAKGYLQQDLIDAGLLTVRDSDGQSTKGDQRVYDRFRHRIMIPIRDENGRMTGFGARIVDPNDIPKFLNSPETPIFTKGHLLYGLDRARKPIRAADQAVIVEGYLDVIALHQAGYENVVSPMGTALTEEQLRLLKKFTRRIVLALDPDAAGQKAVLRGLDAARAAMDREGELGFDARGLLRNEARLQADLRVASMPDGLDPDELVARDPQEWKHLIEKAKPIVEHVLDTLVADRDVNDPKVKNQVAQQVLPLIADLPSAIERDTYRQMLARRLRVDERTLTGDPVQGPAFVRRKPRTAGSRSAAETPVAETVRPSQKIESYALGVLFRKPELCYRLDRLLEGSGLAALSPEDFEYTDHQLFFRVIRQSLEQVEADHHAYVTARIPEDLLGLAKDLLSQTEKLDPVDDRLLEELFRSVIKMRRLIVEANFNQLRFIMEDAQQEGDLRVKSYQEQALQYSRLRNNLDRALKSVNARK